MALSWEIHAFTDGKFMTIASELSSDSTLIEKAYILKPYIPKPHIPKLYFCFIISRDVRHSEISGKKKKKESSPDLVILSFQVSHGRKSNSGISGIFGISGISFQVFLLRDFCFRYFVLGISFQVFHFRYFISGISFQVFHLRHCLSQLNGFTIYFGIPRLYRMDPLEAVT